MGIKRVIRFTLLFAVAALHTLIVLAEEQPVITVSDLRAEAEGGLVAHEILFFFHDGSFDLFDHGEPASQALAAYAGDGQFEALVNEALDAGHAVWRLRLVPGGFQGPWLPEISSPIPIVPPPNSFPPLLDQVQNRFLSFAVRFYPGDDLFYANEDPRRYRLFDVDGQALVVPPIDLFGADLLDAGVRVNDEADLVLVDGLVSDDAVAETGVVLPHPGFQGASRQGADAVPGRLLSAPLDGCEDNGCPSFDPARLDFTEPGTALLRITVSTPRTYINGSLSGSYKDDARTGEGFSIDFIGEDPNQVVVYWYTYAADGSGAPIWLIGQGQKADSGPPGIDPFGFPDYPLDLYVTRGGSFASIDNPDDVELIPWGTARLGLMPEERLILIPTALSPAGCERLRLYAIEPFDDAIELDLPPTTTASGDPPIDGQEYPLVRLGPRLTGQPPPDCTLLGAPLGDVR